MSETPLYKEILYTESEVDARIAEMAVDITHRYKGTDTLFVSLLNGAQPFTAKLMRAIQHRDPYFHPNVQSMIVSRYGSSREGGQPRLVTDLPPEYRELTNRHVVLLDDLVDGGGTTDFTERHLYGYGALRVERIVLVKKLKKPPIVCDLAMYGFEAPDVWLTGMGMDNVRLGREANRWAGWIAIANTD
ncbi:MAG: phosphoribosyltransferase [Acidimicrobiales bacterium]|jgi:hypoxanthine phosphoribosyltransferase